MKRIIIYMLLIWVYSMFMQQSVVGMDRQRPPQTGKARANRTNSSRVWNSSVQLNHLRQHQQQHYNHQQPQPANHYLPYHHQPYYLNQQQHLPPHHHQPYHLNQQQHQPAADHHLSYHHQPYHLNQQQRHPIDHPSDRPQHYQRQQPNMINFLLNPIPISPTSLEGIRRQIAHLSERMQQFYPSQMGATSENQMSFSQRSVPLPQNPSIAPQNSSPIYLNEPNAYEPRSSDNNEVINRQMISAKQIQINERTQQNHQKANRENAMQTQRRNLREHKIENLAQKSPATVNERDSPANLARDQKGNERLNLAQNQREDFSPNDLAGLMATFGNGASSKSPILIADDDGTTDETIEIRHMKRPNDGENAQPKGKQIKLEEPKTAPAADEGSQTADDGKSKLLQIKKQFLNTIWKIVETIFEILSIKVQPIEHTMALVEQGIVFGKSQRLQSALEQMDPDQVMDSISTKLLHTVFSKSKFFSNIICEINSQAKMVFGREIFDVKEDPEKIVKINWVLQANEKMESKKLKALYFFIRLTRKLVGLLETPYKSVRPKDTMPAPPSKRKCMLNWISTTLAQLWEAFDATAGAPNIDGSMMMLNGMEALEKCEFAGEVLRLALFSTGQTLAAFDVRCLVITPNSVLSEVIEKISDNNFMCVLLSTEKPIDFRRILERSIYSQFSYGVASIFNDLLLNAMEQNNANESVTKMQSANVYLKVYEALLQHLNKPDLEAATKQNSRQSWANVKQFLSKSVAQIRNFFDQWELAKRREEFNEMAEFGFEHETERGFISDYLLENCIRHIVKSSKKRSKLGKATFRT